MGKRWSIHPHDTALIGRMERTLNVPPIVAQILICRGMVDTDQAKAFLNAPLSQLRDPEELPGLTDAADSIHAAIEQKKRIIIYGDYDADGMTATAILQGAITLLGGNVGTYVPNRLEDGYGLNSDAIKTLASQGASTIISVDCGITSCEEADTARELDLDLIITDHHAPGDRLPNAAAIVHPALPGSNYPFVGLCGAGVALKLAWGLCQRAAGEKKVGPKLREFLIQAVGLAAIGTVADVVPLLDENRALVRHGLKSLKECPGIGLRHLMEVTSLTKKPYLTAEDIGFVIGPRLNAAGRLGQAALAVELLTTESEERAAALSDYIHRLNEDRGKLERSVYKAANKMVKEQFDPEIDPALVLAGRGWHEGIIGIVAGRLAEKYHRPVVVLALDKLGIKPATGSARSAGGVQLNVAFSACDHHLLKHGGHAAAAGLRIEEKKIDAFRAEFCECVVEQNQGDLPTGELTIDVEAPLSQLTRQTVEAIEALAPFGNGNLRPLLTTSGVTLAEDPKRMGGGERHLSAKLEQHGVTLRAVAFGQGDRVDELQQCGDALEIAYRPVINHWRGRSTVELHLVDWRPVQQPANSIAGGT